jgi:hypothetical protein
MVTKDWEKHELQILIDHHTHMAKEMVETHQMLGEDDDVPSRFMAFARERNRRAMELQQRLSELS